MVLEKSEFVRFFQRNRQHPILVSHRWIGCGRAADAPALRQIGAVDLDRLAARIAADPDVASLTAVSPDWCCGLSTAPRRLR
jgi:hypothetical protein